MTATEAVQWLSLFGHVVLLIVIVNAWMMGSKRRRLFLLPLLFYVAHAVIFYAAIIGAVGYTTSEIRTFWSAVLRFHSILVIGSYVAVYDWMERNRNVKL